MKMLLLLFLSIHKKLLLLWLAFEDVAADDDYEKINQKGADEYCCV